MSPSLKAGLGPVDAHLAAGDWKAAVAALDALERAWPQAYQIALRRAQIAQAQGDVGAHLDHLAVAYGAAPTRAACFLPYATALQQAGASAKAKAVLQDAIRQAPDPALAYLGLAKWAGAESRPEDALVCAAKAVARDRANAEIRHYHLTLLQRAGQSAAALADLDDILRHIPRDAGFHLIRAQLCQDQGDLTEALRSSAAALEIAGTARAAARHVELLFAAGDEAAALDLLRPGRYPDLTDPALHWKAAGLFERRGQFAEALASVEMVLAAGRDTGKVQLLKARLLQALGERAAADSLLCGQIKRFPDNTALVLQLAGHRHRAGQHRAALEVVERALDRHPDQFDLILKQARILHDMGQGAVAKRALEQLRSGSARPAGSGLALALASAGIGSRQLEAAILEDEIAARRYDPALVLYLVRRAIPFHRSEVLDAKFDQLEAGLGLEIPVRVRRELYLHHADYDALEATMSGHKVASRTPTEADQMVRLLIARHKYVLAERYLRFCHRRWPASGTFAIALFNLQLRMGQLDRAERLLGQIEANALLDMARIKDQSITLQLYRGSASGLVTRDEAVDLNTLSTKVIALLLRNTTSDIDIEAADALYQALARLGSGKIEIGRWNSSFLGQLMSEMRLLAAGYGAAWSRETLLADRTRLIEEVRAKPWSTMLATALIAGTGPVQGAAPEDGAPGDRRIPRRVHQYWDQAPPPAEVLALSQSWAMLADCDHTLHNRASALKFLRAECGRSAVQAFQMARNAAEEADFLRLCLLACKGGIWADADDLLYGKLERLVRGNEGAVLFREPVGGAIANNFIAARPGHPIILKAAAWAGQALLQRSNETPWSKTGPGLMSRAVGWFLATADAATLREDLTLYSQDVLCREVSIHNRLSYKSSDKYWNAQQVRDPGYVSLIDRIIADINGAVPHKARA